MVELFILALWLLIIGALGAAVDNIKPGHKVLKAIDRAMTKATESVAYFFMGGRK